MSKVVLLASRWPKPPNRRFCPDLQLRIARTLEVADELVLAGAYEEADAAIEAARRDVVETFRRTG